VEEIISIDTDENSSTEVGVTDTIFKSRTFLK